jgi:hypothetical protein
MRRHVIEAAMPAHDALQERRFEGKLPYLDRIGAAEFHRELASENGDKVRLHEDRSGGEIGHIGGDKAAALACLEELIQKTQILRARTDA